MKNYFIIILSFLIVGNSYCQQTYKESKNLTETFTYKKGDEIRINGERTFINITSTNSNEVSVEVEVISRYSDKVQAKNDLDKIKVQIRKKGKTILYSNALIIDDPKDKPKSNLKTILNITVPLSAKVRVVNSYGGLNLTGSIDDIRINSKFCVTEIVDFKGFLEIITKYGTIKSSNSGGKFRTVGTRSDLVLNKAFGQIEAHLKYGSLDATYSTETEKIDISAVHTPMTLILPEQLPKGLEVECIDCNIDIDNCNNILDEQLKGNKHTIVFNSKSQNELTGKVKSTKSDIKVITTTTSNSE